ncbi:hypothetical protein SAMN05216330_1313 [Bradyrhizobium sp. Ghvi]|nr:hypothetical protein SAMN05216330_1313 [Bradyrhizobium sp. Ghvi]
MPWCFVFAYALPMLAKSVVGPGALLRPVLRAGLPCGHKRDLSGFLVTHPVPLPCSETPAEPVNLTIAAFPVRPRTQHGEGFSTTMISRLPQGLSTCCLRFTSDVTVTHARLASGWRAPPLPRGRRTLWVTLKGFRSHFFLLSRTCPDASWAHGRRAFFELADIAQNARRGRSATAISPVALEAVHRIDQLFEITPVAVAISSDTPQLMPSAPAQRARAGIIEIELGSGCRVRVDRGVDVETLPRVLELLRRR